MDKREYLHNFLQETRSQYGTIPGFIHTTPAGGGANYSAPTWDDEELIAILDSVLFGTWLSSGEAVRKFEKAFSEKFNHEESVMVNSGSSANLMMIAALKKHFGWQDKDEVILSVVGFPTTLSALMVNGLSPVFTDIELGSLNFDIGHVADRITNRTKAIFVSPVLGNSPDMDLLIGLCKDFDLQLILDDCDSLGSKWDGKFLSDYAIASTSSFYPSHHITTGEGGMVSSNNREVIRFARSMSTWGRDCTCVGTDNLLSNGSCKARFKKWLKGQDIILDHKYIFSNMGYNLKPLDLQGAIGLAQLEKFDRIKNLRIRNHDIIKNVLLLTLPELKSPDELPKAETSWFGVPVICPTKEYKVKLVAYLEANKIQTRNYFAGNILLHGAYKHLDNWRQYPEANKVLERVFFLGCSPNYTLDTLTYIEEVIKDFLP